MNNQKRRPPEGHEPDYRFTLANERTFLSWIRTALALLAAAVAFTQLVPDIGIPYLHQSVSAFLAIISIATVAGSALRWNHSQKAMRHNAKLPSTFMPWLLGFGMIVVGLLVVFLALMHGMD